MYHEGFEHQIWFPFMKGLVCYSIFWNDKLLIPKSLPCHFKISPNLKNGELISLYDNVLFIFERFDDQQDWLPMVRESIAKVPNQTAAKWPNCFSSFFRWSSSVLHQPRTGLRTKQQHFFTEQCKTPSLFHNFEVSQGTRSHSIKHYGFQFGTPFSLFVLRMRT